MSFRFPFCQPLCFFSGLYLQLFLQSVLIIIIVLFINKYIVPNVFLFVCRLTVSNVYYVSNIVFKQVVFVNLSFAT